MGCTTYFISFFNRDPVDRLMKHNRIIGQREWEMISLIFFIKLLSVSAGSTTLKQGKNEVQRPSIVYIHTYLRRGLQGLFMYDSTVIAYCNKI